MNYKYNNKTDKIHVIRDTKGKYTGKSQPIPFGIKLVIFAVIILAIYGATMHKKSGQKVDTLEIPIAVVDPELEAVRNREDIKKKQEIIVKETYLNEKKAKIQKEYDAQLAAVESELSALRSEKLAFQ